MALTKNSRPLQLNRTSTRTVTGHRRVGCHQPRDGTQPKDAAKPRSGSSKLCSFLGKSAPDRSSLGHLVSF